MNEQQIEIASDVILKGTIRFPNNPSTGKLPVVVIIHGSGPVDRDGNVKSMSMNAYKLLAEFFSSIGVATLRYDKRGVAESGGDFYETGMWDLVNDGAAAVEAVRKLPEIDSERVFLLGHSEGCTLAPAINKRVQAAGIILLAGHAENVRNATEMQVDLLEKEVSTMKGFLGILLRALKVHKTSATKQKKTFDEIIASDKTVMRKSLAKINAKWIREHFQYENEDDLVSITCPVLAITGLKDVQVNPQHVKLFVEKVNGPGEAYNISRMNHLLRDQEEESSMIKLKSIYKKGFKEPLSPEMLSIIKNWAEKYMLTKSSR